MRLCNPCSSLLCCNFIKKDLKHGGSMCQVKCHEKNCGWNPLKSLCQLQTCVCNREMKHRKEIKTHAGWYCHQINVTNTMKDTFEPEKYWKWQDPLTEHNFINMSFNGSEMTGQAKQFLSTFFSTFYMPWMLISPMSLAFIRGCCSVWATCSSKGEHIT